MEARFLLDTNICIYVKNSRLPEVRRRFMGLRFGEAVLSVVTFGELLYGAQKSSKRAEIIEELEQFRELVPVVPLPIDAAQFYGAIRADFARRGESIGNNDLWIAAHAMAAGLTLVTNNAREFQRIGDLRIQNWAGDSA